MSVQDFFAVVGGRRRRSSVIFLFRHRDGPVKKIKFSTVFQKQAIFFKFKIFRQNECIRSLFAVVGGRRRRSSVIFLFRHRDGPVKKIKFSPFFKKQAIFPKFKIFRQNECTRFFRRRRWSPSSVVRHFRLSSQGRTCEKNQIFSVFQKQAIFPKFKIFRQNECTRFFRRRRWSPSSVVRHFPLSSQGRTCEKNQIFAVFQKQAIFSKFKIFRQNECISFVRRRRWSPSSVVRHFPLSSQGRTCEKNQIFAVFQKQAIFPKFKIFRQNECIRFFRRRRWSPSSVVRHFPLPSQGRTSEKNQYFRFFKNKQSFQNSRFLGKMSVKDFFAIVGRRRRRSSVIFVFRHRDGPVKKIKFSPFFKNKQSFQNSRFLGKMSARDFFAVVGGRRRRSSVIFVFRHRDGPVKKIKFSPFFKNKQSFQNSRFLGKMSALVLFAVVGGRRRRSSVIFLFRHRDGPVKKIKFSPFFKNKQSFQNSRFLGKMSVLDFFAVVGGRRRRSSVIFLFHHRDGPVKKIKFSPFFKNKQSFLNSRFLGKMSARRSFRRRRWSPSSVVHHFRLSSQGRTCEKNQIFAVFQKQAIFPKFKIFRQNECTRFFRRRRWSPSSVVRHFRLSSQGRTCQKNQIFAVFQKQAIFPKFKIFRQNECPRFFRRRRWSPSSVVRHFRLSSQGRTCEKNEIFAVFQKQAIFSKFKIFRQNECISFVRRRRWSPSSVVRHFPLSSQGRTCQKNQIFSVFKKQAIFPKFKIFRQNECIRFCSPSSVVAVVGRPSFSSFVKGTNL